MEGRRNGGKNSEINSGLFITNKLDYVYEEIKGTKKNLYNQTEQHGLY